MTEERKTIVINRTLSSFQWITIITFAASLFKARDVDWKILAIMIIVSMIQDYTRR